MNITALFREFHQSHPLGNIAFFNTLDDAHWRTRPHPAVNSLAWLIWHKERKGHLLMWFGVIHNQGHFTEARTVCSLMGASPG